MITKPKAALFSDLHLGIYGNSEKWHEIALEWADWIVKDLTAKKIKDVFFLGDFFHNRSEISVQTMSVATQILNKFSIFNIVMIVGNHDAYYKNRSDIHSLGLMQGHENITIVSENLEVDAFDKKLLFVPWNNELPEGKFDYIFGHFEIQNFKMNNYKVCDHGLTAMEFLTSRTDTVFSGHFHHRNTKKYKEGSINYIGNTFPMDFADVDNIKGYYILDLEDGDLEFVENTVSPKFKKITASKIKTYTEDDFDNNIIKLIVDIEMTDKQVEKFQTYIAKFKPWQFNTEFNTVSKLTDDVEEIDSIDVLEQFDEYIEQLKFDDDKQKRIDTKIKELYAKNNI
jgi:DNA repair exonuclease SbcCD nuclease subunit|tara:strand:- start:7812 stop:8834 length:1023 start_codon:yes stop_codon:yes gene_type:complete